MTYHKLNWSLVVVLSALAMASGCGPERHDEVDASTATLTSGAVMLKGPIAAFDRAPVEQRFLRDPEPIIRHPGRHVVSLTIPKDGGFGPPGSAQGGLTVSVSVSKNNTLDLDLILQPGTAYEFSYHGLNHILHIYNSKTKRTTCFDPETMIYFDEKSGAPIEVKEAYTP